MSRYEAAKHREEKYGIKFREGEGHLTPPEDYPQDEADYGDPVNYKYPLVPQDRCQNAQKRVSKVHLQKFFKSSLTNM